MPFHTAEVCALLSRREKPRASSVNQEDYKGEVVLFQQVTGEKKLCDVSGTQ